MSVRLKLTDIFSWLILMGFFGCIEPFYPPVGDFSDLLVVEGIITDQAKPQTIKLSRTFGLDTTIILPERYAIVNLLSDDRVISLAESEPGIYKTNQYEFVGEIGAPYQLYIGTIDGSQYLSEAVVLKNVPSVDSVHWQWEEKKTIEEDRILEGVQLYVSTHDPEEQTDYYHWDWEETYEFTADYESLYVYDRDWWGRRERRPEEKVYRCWNTVGNKDILVQGTSQLTTNQVSSFPLNFVSNRTRRLQQRYSILVKQYALSARGYQYWEELKSMTENSGSIFEAQPFQVRGNIRNVNENGMDAIGFFDASAVSEKRIYITRSELNHKRLDLGKSCMKYVGDWSRVRMQRGEIVFLETSSTWTLRYCGDCTLEGETKKPEFW